MKTEDFMNKGPVHCRHEDGIEVMVSVSNQNLGGVIGTAVFAVGQKCPTRGRHKLMSRWEREAYLSKLTPASK